MSTHVVGDKVLIDSADFVSCWDIPAQFFDSINLQSAKIESDPPLSLEFLSVESQY